MLTVFDEAVAILVVEEGFDTPGLSVKERRILLSENFSAASLCNDPDRKDQLLEFMAADEWNFPKEAIGQTPALGSGGMRLFSQLAHDMEGPDAVRHAKLALRLFSYSHEVLESRPDRVPN